MSGTNYAIKKSQKLIAENTFEITFEAPTGFSFKAGQYVTLTLLGLSELPDREQYRDFSVASPPEELPVFRIALRKGKSLFKQRILDLEPGSKVQLDGPGGVFLLPEGSDPVILIAGGIGVTPFHSMLCSQHPHKPVALVTYNNNEPSQPYVEELNTHKDIDFIKYFERPSMSQLKRLKNKYPDAKWLVAGPPGMVASIRSLLEALELSDTMIVTEEFTGYDARQ